jgi:hypothetical protein
MPFFNGPPYCGLAASCTVQYHFAERNRTWTTHFVMVFSVYSEWEHYSLAEKENMATIMANYRRDFDVVIYSKDRNITAATAWCKDKWPTLCPDAPYAPNLGWQFGTYLTFIAEHYHNLPNVTVFLEGDGLDRHTTRYRL